MAPRCCLKPYKACASGPALSGVRPAAPLLSRLTGVWLAGPVVWPEKLGRVAQGVVLPSARLASRPSQAKRAHCVYPESRRVRAWAAVLKMRPLFLMRRRPWAFPRLAAGSPLFVSFPHLVPLHPSLPLHGNALHHHHPTPRGPFLPATSRALIPGVRATRVSGQPLSPKPERAWKAGRPRQALPPREACRAELTRTPSPHPTPSRMAGREHRNCSRQPKGALEGAPVWASPTVAELAFPWDPWDSLPEPLPSPSRGTPRFGKFSCALFAATPDAFEAGACAVPAPFSGACAGEVSREFWPFRCLPACCTCPLE